MPITSAEIYTCDLCDQTKDSIKAIDWIKIEVDNKYIDRCFEVKVICHRCARLIHEAGEKLLSKTSNG